MTALTWDSIGDAADAVNDYMAGSNVRTAAQLYDVGGGTTVDSLAADWQLSDDDRADLLALVRDGWAAGRWTERRSGRDRRDRRVDSAP